LRDKGTDEERHKGTEGQRYRAEGFFCFVPLHLCHFASFFLRTYVPLQLCACISFILALRAWREMLSFLAFHAAENRQNGFLRGTDAFLLSLEIKVTLHLLEEIQACPPDALAKDHLTFGL